MKRCVSNTVSCSISSFVNNSIEETLKLPQQIIFISGLLRTSIMAASLVEHKDMNMNENEGINPHLKKYNEDTLFHLGFCTSTDNFQEMFGDVRFVCMGGTPNRMRKFCEYVAKELGIVEGCTDYTKGERYGIFKAGRVLCVSHGIGKPSASIVLHEIIKLLHYAKCQDVVFIRIGTCGGIDCEPGTVVVSDNALNEMFKAEYNLPVLGKVVSRPTHLSQDVAEDLLLCVSPDDTFPIIRGNTLCTSDFFEGQARLDGALCHYTEAEKTEYLVKAREAGVRNIEMESVVIAGMCNAANIKVAVVCVSLVDRLQTDQVVLSLAQVHDFELRPMKVVLEYIRRKLGKA